jgi:transcriptional regulator with XRE-family HTH domain
MELVEKKESLTGKEIRFLRHELEMSQALLAKLLQVTEQTVHRWEKGKAGIPKPAETLIRLLYRDQLEPKPKLNVKEQLERIADMEHAIDARKLKARRKNREWLVEAEAA